MVRISILFKPLGHREIGTTEIYARIIDKKMREAVNLLSKLNADLSLW
ncbi:hypothetical protein SAMN04487911_14510 [Arenibacter nanhaiticus]|uniref:Phage integrase family protein n=1 Tax=Arenibacter nanhaiticus TaxID=558155 RepID=A0A1M6MPA2_9FLAO|nr:hypothetical protein SAMN04487911_14510 [Arenibacter nanhaiticus]